MTQIGTTINGFTPAQALNNFGSFALDLDVVRCWVGSMLHPDPQPACPGCSTPIVSHRVVTTFNVGGRVCCPNCKKFFTNRTNTILHGSQLEFEQVYLIAVLLALKVERREIARIVGQHPDSIKNWEKIFAALETPLV
jgi:transposase-like protein